VVGFGSLTTWNVAASKKRHTDERFLRRTDGLRILETAGKESKKFEELTQQLRESQNYQQSMLDEDISREIRRRKAADEEFFQEGDIVEIDGWHVYNHLNTHNIPFTSHVENERLEAESRPFITYPFERRRCYHSEHWTMVRPRHRN